MAYSSSRLPSRFPVGTKFVIEGARASEGQVQVYSRYLEFPDGPSSRCRRGRPSARPRARGAPAAVNPAGIDGRADC